MLFRSGGMTPKITINELRNLLTNFAQSRELGQWYDFIFQENPLLLIAANFSFADRFLRVWYCSDGQSLVLVTYNCDKGHQDTELADCENIVRSIKFGV